MTTAGRLHTGLSSIAIFLYFDAFSPFTIMRVAPISSHMIELPPISSISHARRLSARRWTFLEVALLLKNAQKKKPTSIYSKTFWKKQRGSGEMSQLLTPVPCYV